LTATEFFLAFMDQDLLGDPESGLSSIDDVNSGGG